MLLQLVFQRIKLPRFHCGMDAKILEMGHLLCQLSYLLSKLPTALGKTSSLRRRVKRGEQYATFHAGVDRLEIRSFTSEWK